jgi:hypothetical protein
MPMESSVHTNHAVFDPETITVLRDTLESAWEHLTPDQRSSVSKTALAERMLTAAARGERDPVRLREHALSTLLG